MAAKLLPPGPTRRCSARSAPDALGSIGPFCGSFVVLGGGPPALLPPPNEIGESNSISVTVASFGNSTWNQLSLSCGLPVLQEVLPVSPIARDALSVLTLAVAFHNF